jgi:hypothetical protein
VAVLGAAWVFALSFQPAKTVFQQSDRLFALRRAERCSGRIARIEQLHQCGGQLFGGAALGLAFEGMPLQVVDAEQAVQLFCRFTAANGPMLRG